VPWDMLILVGPLLLAIFIGLMAVFFAPCFTAL
jgi:hypothetical protein